MMQLDKILSGINIISISGDKKIPVESITFDSRNVTKNSLFVAVKGSKTDGHDYITDAVRSGATTIIGEVLPENPDKKICWIKTRSIFSIHISAKASLIRV